MIPFLLDHVIGIIRPIGPQRWAFLIGRLRRADGWMPPTLLIATMGSLFILGRGFGLLASVRSPIAVTVGRGRERSGERSEDDFDAQPATPRLCEVLYQQEWHPR
jgi:hypothetical protein